MGKHDLAKREKAERNGLYASRFKQMRCGSCGHKSSQQGRCAGCGEKVFRNHADKKAHKMKERSQSRSTKIVDA